MTTTARPEPADVPPTGDPAVPPASRRAALITTARWALIVLVLVAAGWQVVRQWTEVREALVSVHPLAAVLSFVCVILGLVAGTMSWQTLLDDLGPRVGIARGAQICLVGQLGKYVPGSVWAYLLQMEIGRRHGVARARVFATSLFAAGVGVVASLVLGLAALPVLAGEHRELLWLFALLPVGLVCLHPRVMTWLASAIFRLLRKPPLDHTLRVGVVGRSLGWALLSYLLFGVHLWLLANSLVDPGPEALLLCAGAIALGFTAGLFAVFLPSGVGVREAVLVAALATMMSVGSATGVAVASRLVFTVGDLTVAGLAALTAVVARRRMAAAGLPTDVPDELRQGTGSATA
ncbi:lysylphosphatidylglycerol synthase transmembrane domain-containing protein [Cellulomonas sp. S1-8]|uniref:lysylphosphatidylglycerol synthase transmembrane domain-containing protein n=1 Tax=Cellulomonas sp. S1-8 TaxID=2904790 RepID=UPI0022431567|nr:lysylphosphatidylglycerol synthase transmembrane domain-containing protein [Cellulomonas sp. S1-8]UZN01925.1 flippase-like domain-containing protein [Cellulomonas sp. S1-8]